MLIYEKVIQTDFSIVDQTVKEALEKIEQRLLRLPSEIRFNINFMLREILNNAVEHGNHMDYEKKINLVITLVGEKMVFSIQDEGEGIDLIHCKVCTNHEKHAKAYHKIKDNAGLELVKALNELRLENEITTRNRGFETIKMMNFDITIENNKVIITLDLNQEADNGLY